MRRRWISVMACAAGLALLSAALPRASATLRTAAGRSPAFAAVVQLYAPARVGTVDCWGDSLTEGRSAGLGHDFPSLLNFLFDRGAVNRGVAGETSAQVRARMSSRPAPEGPESAVIWAGRNDDLSDPATTEGNVDAMVVSLPAGSRFLVLGLLNSDTRRERRGGDRYAAIVGLNERFRTRYGASFVPIRDILVARGLAGDEADRAAALDDVVPPSFRVDALHLNGRGEAAVATAVEDAMRSNRW